MRIPAAVLLFFLCLRAVADTSHAQPPCTCTVNFPPTQSSAVTRELRRATCHCAVTSATARSDIRGTTQSPSKVDLHELPPDRSNAVFAAATIALALITGTLAFYTAKLWRATRRLVESGEGTAQRQLRAYVGVSEVAYEEQIDGRAPRVSITIRNFGATPAYKLAVAADAQIAFSVDQVPVATSTSKTLGHLPPGVELRIPRSAVMSIGAAPGYEVGTAHSRVFVYGCIEYVDTFGEPHFTRFRLEESSDRKFFASDEGNDTDDVLLARTSFSSVKS
ncbi:MAG: hypothetical protein QOI59_2941 [Gammaproteobacteria bacterium]|nr:hypothetical protein [Gammaproteobacteria bacterium]